LYSCRSLIVHWAALIAFEPSIPPPAEWQDVGNQIDATMIPARAEFVNVHFAPSR